MQQRLVKHPRYSNEKSYSADRSKFKSSCEFKQSLNFSVVQGKKKIQFFWLYHHFCLMTVTNYERSLKIRLFLLYCFAIVAFQLFREAKRLFRPKLCLITQNLDFGRKLQCFSKNMVQSTFHYNTRRIRLVYMFFLC